MGTHLVKEVTIVRYNNKVYFKINQKIFLAKRWIEYQDRLSVHPSNRNGVWLLNREALARRTFTLSPFDNSLIFW